MVELMLAPIVWVVAAPDNSISAMPVAASRSGTTKAAASALAAMAVTALNVVRPTAAALEKAKPLKLVVSNAVPPVKPAMPAAAPVAKGMTFVARIPSTLKLWP